MGLDVQFLVRLFVYFHTLCVRTGKALARLRRCACSPEPTLVAYREKGNFRIVQFFAEFRGQYQSAKIKIRKIISYFWEVSVEELVAYIVQFTVVTYSPVVNQ